MSKKTTLRIALLLGTLVSLYFVPWPILMAWADPAKQTVQEQLDRAKRYGFEGAIVYIDKGGEESIYASGWHNRDQQIKAYPDALFKIASIGKLYDAVTVTRLVHRNVLSLDRTLLDYLPELDQKIPNAERITLKMLIQHQSGIANVTDTESFWTDPPKDAEESLSRVFNLPSNFEPGSTYAYSNTNYLLLSLIVKRVTKSGMFEAIRQEILSPLELENTFESIHEIDTDRLMSGYYIGVDEDIKGANYGSMVATASDVGRFVKALNKRELLSEEEQQLYESLYRLEHTGLIPGYQSIAKYHPEIDAVVVLFTNTTNFDGYHWNLGEVLYNKLVRVVRRG